MKTLVVVGSIVAVGAIVFAVVPALKGPYNRWKINANEQLNAEYVVDNYKAEYVNLHEKRAEVLKALQHFKVEKEVNSRKLDQSIRESESAKSRLKAVGTSDIKMFNQLKDIYETCQVKTKNYETLIGTYDKAIVQLEQSLALIESNMSKAKMNVETLASKKTMLDAVKSVNKSIENLNGTGDTDLAVNVEKLDDDMLRESVKLDALSIDNKPTLPMSEAEAKAYLENLN